MSPLLYAVLHLLCTASSPPGVARFLHAAPQSVSSLTCARTVRNYRCASSVQDHLDPSKDDDVILAHIIAAASSKHRNSKRMKLLQQRVLVSLLVTR